MHTLRLLGQFMRTSFQEETAYRANFWIGLVHSLLNLGTGVLGIWVLFSQVETVQGWDFVKTLALMGVYLTVGALRNFVIAPSLDSLSGMDGDVWSGRMDFTLIRPVDTQFLVSFRKWRPFALVDLALGLGVLAVAVSRLEQALAPASVAAFLVALAAAMAILYAIQLAFTTLVFWSPGVLFTWVFDGVFQIARYPIGLYPGWMRLVLTWIIPVGMITTVPAQALSGDLTPGMLAAMCALALALCAAASLAFHAGMRRYASASS